MNRRDETAISGFVRFPIDRFPNSGEGGVFVRLVVIPNESSTPLHPYQEFMQCCGGYNSIVMDETLLGDDETARIPEPLYPKDGDVASLKAWADEEQEYSQSIIGKHFPGYYDDSIFQDEYDRHLSRQYLAVITIGSTGWSSSEWCCQYDDLTEDGKALYDQLAKLYGGTATLSLQTWLDT